MDNVGWLAKVHFDINKMIDFGINIDKVLLGTLYLEVRLHRKYFAFHQCVTNSVTGYKVKRELVFYMFI